MEIITPMKVWIQGLFTAQLFKWLICSNMTVFFSASVISVYMEVMRRPWIVEMWLHHGSPSVYLVKQKECG